MRLSKPTQTLPKGGVYENTENMKLSFINELAKPPLRGGLEGLL